MVIRKVPPNVTEQEFLAHPAVSKYIPCSTKCFLFNQGLVDPLAPLLTRNGVCYAVFAHADDIPLLASDLTVAGLFSDANGQPARLEVEFAPNQRFVKKRYPNDLLQDSIEVDADYQAFLKSLAEDVRVCLSVCLSLSMLSSECLSIASNCHRLVPFGSLLCFVWELARVLFCGCGLDR